jgi:hypothetical protein
MNTEPRDYVAQWFNDLRRRGENWKNEAKEAIGICDIITGPRRMYARVRIGISPGDTLNIVSVLDEGIYDRLEREGFLDFIVYGVLDVLLVEKVIPCTSFTLMLFEADIHDVHSSQMAFRCAAQDAARQLIGKRSG